MGANENLEAPALVGRRKPVQLLMVLADVVMHVQERLLPNLGQTGERAGGDTDAIADTGDFDECFAVEVLVE